MLKLGKGRGEMGMMHPHAAHATDVAQHLVAMRKAWWLTGGCWLAGTSGRCYSFSEMVCAAHLAATTA